MNEIVVSSEKRFSKAILGLNKNEVYMYLSQVSSAYEELQLQIQVLKEQNNTLSDSNRENALKLYNLQNEVTEAQKKADRTNAEAESLKKENASLKRELEAAERRISKLTDDLIKTGADIESEPVKTEASPVEETVAETKKEYTPDPIFAEPEKKEESVNNGGFRDIFADLRSSVAKEAEQEKKEDVQTAAAVDTGAEDDDEVYAGEVETKVDESMLIGNDDDEEEGFTFL